MVETVYKNMKRLKMTRSVIDTKPNQDEEQDFIGLSRFIAEKTREIVPRRHDSMLLSFATGMALGIQYGIAYGREFGIPDLSKNLITLEDGVDND